MHDCLLCLSIRDLISLVPDFVKVEQLRYEYVEDWVDETGRIVLIGDAAHPLLVRTHS